MIRRPPRSTLFPYTNALPISIGIASSLIPQGLPAEINTALAQAANKLAKARALVKKLRSEEHTSELQSQSNLVCRLLLEKKKNNELPSPHTIRLTMISTTSPI